MSQEGKIKSVQLRQDQQNLSGYIEKNGDEISKVNSKAADKVLNKLSSQLSRIKNTTDASKDSTLFANVSRLTTKQVYKIGDEDNRLTPTLLTTKLIEKFKKPDGNFDLESFGKSTSVFFSSCLSSPFETLNFFNGPIRTEQKKRAVPMHRQVKPKYKEESAVRVVNDEENAEDRTKQGQIQEVIVQKIIEQTAKKKQREARGEPILVDETHLFKILVNPKSFTQTVENIFEFTFLVNDGWAGYRLDTNGNPLIFLRDAAKDQISESKASSSSGPKKISSVLSITLAEFTEIVQKMKLEESIIPHRTDPEYDPNYIYKMNEDHLQEASSAKKRRLKN